MKIPSVRMLIFFVVLAALALGGCARMRSSPLLPEPPAAPLLSAEESLRRLYSGDNGSSSTLSQIPVLTDTSATLTLDNVLAIAAKENPTFAEFRASRDAAHAEVLQALAYPNPELSAGAAIAAGKEEPKDTVLEYGLGLVQPLEWPGKRKARKKAAQALEPIVEREEDAFRSTLRADTAKAYFTVLYYEHSVGLAKDALRVEEQIAEIVARRVEAGEVAEIDRVKARVEVLKASRAVQAAQRQRTSARAILNALCGRALPPAFVLHDNLETSLTRAHAEQAAQIALAQHPTLRRLDAVAKQRELAIRREQKAWYPDLKPGIDLANAIDARSIGATLETELPLWNRNRGGIAAARAELQRAQAELARARQEVLRDVETGMQSYESAREQLGAFQTGLRAAAAESLGIETFMYQEGEVDFLQLLDARRTARQTEAEYLQALYDAQVARTELEKSIGIGGEQP